MFSKLLLASLSLGALAVPSMAQSTIYGMDVRLQRFFTTNTGTFVTSFTPIGANPNPIFALDFDETATTLWGVNNTTLEYGTFDLTTGVFTPVAVLVSGPTTGATGLTCDVNGVWYLSTYDAGTATSSLWKGNVTTGTFTLVGPIIASINIDISIDSNGNMFGHNISTDSLYSIDTTTGAGTLIGVTGLAANFAQGMDFDWSTNTLYATIYTGGGVGNFVSLDVTTGLATVLDVTTPLNAEMEIAIQEPASGPGGPTTFCPPLPAGTTNGCVPTISATAQPNVAHSNTVVITAAGVEGQKLGLIFYGVTGQVNSPWCTGGSSFLCVKAPTQRMPSGNTNGTAGLCDGTLVQDWNAFQLANPFALGNPWISGAVVDIQGWFRDPPACKTTSLTEGLQLTYQ